MVRLVEVVDVAHYAILQYVGETQKEHTSHPAFPSARRSLQIGDVPNAVLLLQVHVHHIAGSLHVIAQRLALVRAFVVGLDVLHRIVGQILQQYLPVATQEGTRPEQQLVHLAAVHVYLPFIGHLHPWQLPYQRIQHRTVGKVEGIGVVHDGVTPVVHLHPGGLHLYLGEVPFHASAHPDGGQLQRILFIVGHRYGMPHLAVAPLGDMQQIVLLFRRQEGAVPCAKQHHPVHPKHLAETERIHHHGAVCVEYGDFHVTECLLQKSVLHIYPHFSLLRMERKGQERHPWNPH